MVQMKLGCQENRNVRGMNGITSQQQKKTKKKQSSLTLNTNSLPEEEAGKRGNGKECFNLFVLIQKNLHVDEATE